MKLMPPIRLTRVFRLTPASKNLQALRAILLISVVAATSIVLGSSSSASSVAQLFTRAASFLGHKQVTPPSATESNAVVAAEESAELALQTPSSSMTIERRGHTATRLSDGRLLIAGGVNGAGGNLNAAEIFDPATTTF